MFALQARMAAPGAQWRVWTVASAIWMIDGINILGEPGATPRMARILQGLPRSTQEILFAISLGLFARQTRATQGVEAYCYERASRYQWRTLGGDSFVTQAGVPGVERMGTNQVQRMWAAFNTYEDQRDQAEIVWGSAKLAASAMSSKGIQKIDAKDKERQRKEEQRRQMVMDYFCYWALGLIDDPNPYKAKGLPETGAVDQHKTVEELEDEMKRWVSGEDDWHDRVIREYKKRIIERTEREKADLEARTRALQAQAALRGTDMLPSTSLVGYTPDQLNSILDGRPGAPEGVKQVTEGGDSRGHLYSKYIEKAPSAGNLRTEGGRVITQGDEEGRLAAEIANRQVAFTKGE